MPFGDGLSLLISALFICFVLAVPGAVLYGLLVPIYWDLPDLFRAITKPAKPVLTIHLHQFGQLPAGMCGEYKTHLPPSFGLRIKIREIIRVTPCHTGDIFAYQDASCMEAMMSIRVLFICTGNSARSQMAEHILRSLGSGHFEVFSAGTSPRDVHPLTIAVLNEMHIDASKATSKGLDVFRDQPFDYIITVCDKAKNQCPKFPGDTRRIHWGFEDPAAVIGDDETQLKAFRHVCVEIANRIRIWIAAVDK